MGLAVGSATINDTIYNQVALRPELSFGKLGIGLDLVMYIDNEGNIRKDEWDEPSDFIDKPFCFFNDLSNKACVRSLCDICSPALFTQRSHFGSYL